MRFFDRQAELARLGSLLRRKEGALAVIWGRRRVGKSRLLLEWCRQAGGLYTVADQSAEAVQRQYFAESLSPRFPSFGEARYPDWRALLRALAREAARESWKGPLIVDELPYLIASAPALASQLQAWIDGEAREAGLVVAMAGSSQHMMHGLALDASSPLFGRASEAILLPPLPPGDLSEALGLRSEIETVQAFAMWGGIPRYWELAEPFGRDLDAAVDQLVLDPLGPLHREPDRLLAEELPSATSLRPLLDAIGAGAHRLSEVAGRLGQPATSLGRPLGRLMQMGLVRKEQPYEDHERAGKRTLYRIDDPFFRLWFRMVAPHRSFLAQVPAQQRLRLWHQQRAALVAETWEELSRRSVPRLSEKLPVLGDCGPWGPAARLWGRGGPEWDVVAKSVDGKHLLLGEVKWQDKAASVAHVRNALADLERKGVPRELVPDGTRVHRALFLPKVEARARTLVRDVAVVEAADVIEALTAEP
ncbi:MAG: ATP-binding protein [Deltaproteobacteria bacterium]|nr:ATP-binding protein [Deltaproteobacteria bacterium]